jgi:hypothetical protein
VATRSNSRPDTGCASTPTSTHAWEWWAADPPGSLRPWTPGETLPGAVHDIWCRPSDDQPWRIQLMLDECDGDDWVSRRNPGIRRAIPSIGKVTENGLPYLAPEIQLFYKAGEPRLKDEADFTAIRQLLTATQRDWLREAFPEPTDPIRGRRGSDVDHQYRSSLPVAVSAAVPTRWVTVAGEHTDEDEDTNAR